MGRLISAPGIRSTGLALLFALVTVGCGSKSDEPLIASGPGFYFPGPPGPVGTTLPEHGCGDPNPSPTCVQLGGFNRLDYECWGNQDANCVIGQNERMSWVADPAGSGKTVARYEVYGTDRTEQFPDSSAARGNSWQRPPNGNCNGCEHWQAIGFYLPVGFQRPDQWMLLYQNHGGTGNPAQAIELRSGVNCASGGPRDRLCYKIQTAPGSGRTYYDMGPVNPGHWHYVVAHIYFTSTASGFVQVWHGTDAMPNVGFPPNVVDRANVNTLYPGYENLGFRSMLLYRGASAASQHQVAYYCGFHVDTTAASATYLPTCPA